MSRLTHLSRGFEMMPDQRGAHRPPTRVNVAECGVFGPAVVFVTVESFCTCKTCRDERGRRGRRILKPNAPAPVGVDDDR